MFESFKKLSVKMRDIANSRMMVIWSPYFIHHEKNILHRILFLVHIIFALGFYIGIVYYGILQYTIIKWLFATMLLQFVHQIFIVKASNISNREQVEVKYKMLKMMATQMGQDLAMKLAVKTGRSNINVNPISIAAAQLEALNKEEAEIISEMSAGEAEKSNILKDLLDNFDK